MHFWHYHNEILSDLYQLPDEGMHSLSTHINTLVVKCKFTSEDTKDTIKIMLLQYTEMYHDVRNWIHLQDQKTLTVSSKRQTVGNSIKPRLRVSLQASAQSTTANSPHAPTVVTPTCE